jgi:hypothetical protein
VYRGEKQTWELPGRTKSVNFDGLLEALRDHWNKLASKYAGVDEITIIGIDLSKRNR